MTDSHGLPGYIVTTSHLSTVPAENQDIMGNFNSIFYVSIDIDPTNIFTC